MAFAARSGQSFRLFATLRGARRVPNVARPTTYGHIIYPQINTLSKSGRRKYHSGGSGYSAGQQWDGLVYSTMSNLRGQTTHGPECFYRSSDESDSETDSSTTDSSTSPSASSPPERRDMRDEVPLKLNRPYLRQTASDILLRLRLLAKNEEGSEDYERLVNLAQLLTWLSNMESESPKLEMPEYAKIWMTIRDGMQAANDMTLQILSFQEEQRLREIKWTANCMWGVGCLNAAVRRLDPEQRFEEGSEYVRTFEGDLRSLSGQIHGLLLDSKDFWPEGKKWFGSEEEERILEAVWRVYCESQRRDY